MMGHSARNENLIPAGLEGSIVVESSVAVVAVGLHGIGPAIVAAGYVAVALTMAAVLPWPMNFSPVLWLILPVATVAVAAPGVALTVRVPTGQPNAALWVVVEMAAVFTAPFDSRR